MKTNYHNRPGGSKHTRRLSPEQLEDITQRQRMERFAKNHAYAKQ